MRTLAAPHRSGHERSRRIGGSVVAPVAVLVIYAVVVLAAGRALDHVVARAGRDWPLLLLAVAGALVPGMLAPRAPRRWRSLLAACFGGLAAGVAWTAAVGGGGHTFAELEGAVGTRLPTAALAASSAALVAIALLVGACVSVHGARMTRRRSRPPAPQAPAGAAAEQAGPATGFAQPGSVLAPDGGGRLDPYGRNSRRRSGFPGGVRQ